MILTGGDPLVLSPRRLRAMRASARRDRACEGRALPHAACRSSSPERVDAALVAALKARGKTVYVALHANHPRELTPAARAACARLVDAGIPMVSQTVLLQRRQRRCRRRSRR